MVVIMQNTQEKADLQKTKVSATKIRKVCVDGNKLWTGKEWRPNTHWFGLQVDCCDQAGRHADKMLAVYKIFEIQQI